MLVQPRREYYYITQPISTQRWSITINRSKTYSENQILQSVNYSLWPGSTLTAEYKRNRCLLLKRRTKTHKRHH
jgi:hypothetical protein